MSTENSPNITPAPLPEPEVVAVPSPEETDAPFTPGQVLAFAQHISEVREHGDALNIPLLEGKTLGFRELGPSAILTPLGVIASANYVAGTVLGLVGFGVMFSGSAWAHTRRHMPKSGQRIGITAQAALGEGYTLFSMPKGRGSPDELALRYYGPLIRGGRTPEEASLTLPERILRMAKLAEEHGVKEFILEQYLIKDMTDDKVYLESMQDVLKRRGVYVDPPHFATDWVGCQSPTFWRDLTPRTQSKHTPGQEKPIKMKWFIDRLRSINPDNPLVAAHDGLKKAPALQQDTMHSIARASLMRLYTETEIIGTSRKEQILGADPRPKKRIITADISPLTPVREWKRVNEEGMNEYAVHTLPGSDGQFKLVWTDSYGAGVREASVSDLTRMTPAQMKAFVENEDIPSHKREELLVLLIGEMLRINATGIQEKEVIKREDKITHPAPAGSTANVFDLLLSRTDTYDPYSKRKVHTLLMHDWLAKKIAAGVLCVAALATATSLASIKLRNNYNEELQAANVEISRELGVDPEDHDVLLEYMRDRAYSNSPMAEAWGTLQDQMEWLNNALDFSKKSNGNGGDTKRASTTGVSISTGDFRRNTEAPPVSEWHLKTNGLPTDGYWTAATSFQIGISDKGVEWSRTSTADSSVGYRSTQKELDESVNSIKVIRDLAEADFVGEKGYIRIPIRENTQVAAANIDGQQVYVGKQPDGAIYIIAGNLPKRGKLEYWLTEDKLAPKPHAYKPISPMNGRQQFDTASIKATWEEFIPGFIDKTPLEQEALMRAYLQEHFYYERDPFPDGTNRDARDPADYTRRTVKGETADCSVGNGTVALNYLTNSHIYETDDHAVINPADGYLNKKGVGENVLSSRELHMWNVDTNGRILDSTPGKRRLKVEVADSEGNLLPWALGSAVFMLTVAAAAAANPRRTKAEWENLKFRLNSGVRAEQSLLKTNPVTLATALEVANTVLYDKEGRRDIQAAIARARATAAASALAMSDDPETDKHALADKAIEKLLRNDLLSDSAQHVLRQHRKRVKTIPQKWALMRTGRILRGAARANEDYEYRGPTK